MCTCQIINRLMRCASCEYMNQKYVLITVSVVVAAVFIGCMYVMWKSAEPTGIQDFSGTRAQRALIRENIKDRLEKSVREQVKEPSPLSKRLNPPLSEDKKAQAITVLQEDALVRTLLDYLDHPAPRIMKRVNQNISVISYTTEKEWIMHVTVNHATGEVETITLTQKGSKKVLNAISNPQDIIKVAESQLGQQIGKSPLIGKVVQTSEGVEVEFLSDSGIVKVAMKVEDGKIIEIDPISRHSVQSSALQWAAIITIGAAVGIIVIVGAIYWKKKRTESQSTPEEPTTDHEPES